MKNRTIIWVLKQKRGIRIIQPNENLTKAYLKKAISALNTMNAALEIRETDWITTTAYYAKTLHQTRKGKIDAVSPNQTSSAQLETSENQDYKCPLFQMYLHGQGLCGSAAEEEHHPALLSFPPFHFVFERERFRC